MMGSHILHSKEKKLGAFSSTSLHARQLSSQLLSTETREALHTTDTTQHNYNVLSSVATVTRYDSV